MSFIPHIIATAVFITFIPTATSDVHIPEPDPLPEPAAEIVEPPTEPEPEVKPIPNADPVVKDSACNCYNILTDNFDSVPSMNQLQATAGPDVGNVAVFMYAPSANFPNGTPHVALVHEVLPDGTVLIEEYNYRNCTHSFRTIPLTYPRLVGFTNL